MVKKSTAPVDIAEAMRTLGENLKVQRLKPNILTYKPHAKQFAFHSSEARTRLYIGGNRSGKTVGGIIEDILWLTGKHPFRKTPLPPISGRIVSVDFLNGIARTIIPQLSQWLPASELKGGSWDTAYNKELRTLTLDNGSFVEFMSYDQDLDKFSGTSRHFIHFDEEPPKDIYTECLLRTVDVGGSIWITMTPVEGMTWVYDDIYEPGIIHTRQSTDVITVDMTENPYLSEGEIQSLINLLDEEDREARIHGKFVQLGGLIYKAFDPNIHVISRDRLEIPKDGVIVASLDAGFNNPTAWLWHYITPDERLFTYKEHYASGMVVEEHAQIVHQINKEFGRAPDYYVGDPSIRNTDPLTGTSIHQEYMKYGIPIILGNNDVRAGIVRVAGYMRDRPGIGPSWHVTANCTAIISELLKYRWKTYANKRLANQNNLQEEPHKKNDHACDSLRYFIMSRPDLTADYANRSVDTSDPNQYVGAPTGIDPLMPQIFRGQEESSSSSFSSDYNSTGSFKVDDNFMGGEW